MFSLNIGAGKFLHNWGRIIHIACRESVLCNFFIGQSFVFECVFIFSSSVAGGKFCVGNFVELRICMIRYVLMLGYFCCDESTFVLKFIFQL